MSKNVKFRSLTFLVLIGLIALAAVITLNTEDDPCANPQQDISASVLADDADQDGMVNRAILVAAECERRKGE